MGRMWGRSALVFALGLMVLAGALLARSPALVTAAPDCSAAVTNGGFEDPQIASFQVGGATGWSGTYELYHSPSEAHSGNQLAYVADSVPVTSQQLATAGLLAGQTITISFWRDTTIMVQLGSTTQTFTGGTDYVYQQNSLSYTLVTDAEPVTLSFTNINGTNGTYLDDVSATCTDASSPTPTNTPTATATATSTPTSTPTNTPTATPTNTPTDTPTATATSTPTATATAVPTDTATTVPTDTATSAPTSTTVPTIEPSTIPTDTATTAPTEVPTSTELPATSTAVPSVTSVPTSTAETTGAAAVTLTTSDGGDVPDTTQVCVGDVCQTVGAGASAAAVSPTTLTFANLDPGTYPVTVTNDAPYADAASTVTVTAGETAQITITLEAVAAPTTVATEPGNATPVTTVTVVPTQGTGGDVVPTTAPSTGGGGGVAPSKPAGSTGGTTVKALPNTGSGQGGSSTSLVMLLLAMLAVGAAGTLAWRRRTR